MQGIWIQSASGVGRREGLCFPDATTSCSKIQGSGASGEGSGDSAWGSSFPIAMGAVVTLFQASTPPSFIPFLQNYPPVLLSGPKSDGVALRTAEGPKSY